CPGYALPVVELAAPSPKTPNIQIPAKLGKIELLSIAGPDAPSIIHIQTAHGNYEAQKNIQAILQHISKNYDVDLLLLEGGIGKLDPRLFNFFPENPGLNVKVADTMMQKSELTGAEAFLVETMSRGEDENIAAFGVENAALYREDRRAFQEVVRQREKSETFLKALEQQINQQAERSLNSVLKSFLKSFDAYENKQSDPISFYRVLKKEADRNLHLDLSDTVNQIQWPMLTRLLRLDSLKSKIDFEKAEAERHAFLVSMKSLGIYFSIPKIDVRQAFERLLESLPANFSFKPYKNFRLLIQSQILQEEIDSAQLFQESEQLERHIIDSLTRTKAEKETISRLENFRLLRKLFSLTLTRGELKTLMRKRRNIEPSVQNIRALFDTAITFYIDAGKREDAMFQNALSRMKQLHERRAILVTGGYHSEGLTQLAQENHLNYLRISPEINMTQNNRDYILAMMESHLEAILKLQTNAEIDRQGGNPDYFREQIKEAIAQSMGSDGTPKTVFSEQNFAQALETLKLLTLTGKDIVAVRFSPDSKYLFVEDSNSRRELFDLSLKKNAQYFVGNEIKSVAFSNNGKFLYVIYNNSIGKLFDLTTKKEIPINQNKNVQDAQFSSSDKFLIIRIYENTYVFDLEMPTSPAQEFRSWSGDGVSVGFTPNNKLLVQQAVSYGANNVEVSYSYFDLFAKQAYHLPVKSYPNEGVISQNGKYLYIDGGKAYPPKVLEIESQKDLQLPIGSDVGIAAFSPSGRFLVVIYSDSKPAQVFDLLKKSNRQLSSSSILHWDITFSPNSSYVFLVYKDGLSKVLNLETNTERPLKFKSQPQKVIFSGSTELVAAIYKDATAVIFDLNNCAKINIPLGNNIRRLSFSHNGRFLRVEYGPSYITESTKVFEVKTKYDLKRLIGGNTAIVTFSPDAHLILVKYEDGTEKLFDLRGIFLNPILRSATQKWGEKFSGNMAVLAQITKSGDINKVRSILQSVASSLGEDKQEKTNLIAQTKTTLALKTLASITAISAVAFLIYGTPLKAAAVLHIGVNIANILIFGYFAVMNDLLGQWMSGRGIVKKQVAWALPLGLVLGVVTWGGFKMTNWALPKDVAMPVIAADALRIIAIWVMIRVRTMLYAKMVNLVRKNGKSKEEQEKQFESFWMTRSLSFVKNYFVLKFIPAEFQTVAEGILNQYFQLFYSWSVNKDGFIFSSKKFRESRLALAFFPITAPIAKLRQQNSEPPSNEITAASLGYAPMISPKLLKRERVIPKFIVLTAHYFAGDFFYLPDTPDVLKSYLRILGIVKQPVRLSSSIAAFNHDNNLNQFMDYLKKKPGHESFPALVHERILREGDSNPLSKAKLISGSLSDGDFLIAALRSQKVPRVISELHKLSHARFKVRTLQEKLASASRITSMTRGYNIPLVAVTAFEDQIDLDFTSGDSIKLNLRTLVSKGVDPIQVLALIFKISDEPTLRNSLYFQSGFRFDPARGFWEVGDAFIALLDTIYSKYSASQQSARAA
ncbi:MAG: WD40 repeat domain-containing protein, partial [Candidatus Omnitrophica bacterium]|nr:WD40 repeat domain-containing protein [Candidatus Omnitrophota bacterium]